jgi:hypothetical protein
MARGNSRASSELPPSREQRAKQAIKNAPKDTDYLENLTPFDDFHQAKNEDNLYDVISDYLSEFDVLDAKYENKNDSPALANFKKEVDSALEGAKGDGSELVSRGSFSTGYEQDEVWNGEGNSGKTKTVLQAKGAPAIEITWHVYAYTDDDERGSRFKAKIKLDNVKIL